jgi:hypothetical protein
MLSDSGNFNFQYQIRGMFSDPYESLLADSDQIIYAAYASYPPEKLLKEIDWCSLDGHIAYKVLATQYFDEFSSRIRFDLGDRFETLKQESMAKYRSRHLDGIQSELEKHPTSTERESLEQLKSKAEDQIRQLMKSWEKLEHRLQGQYIASALGGIATHGRPEDIQIARRYLEESIQHDNSYLYKDIQLESIRIIERFGDASNTEILIKIALDNHGELQKTAASAALKLNPGVDGVARTLLECNNSTLAELAIKSLLSENSEEAKQLLEPFLSKDVNFRIKVVAYFAKCCTKGELEQLLLRYLKGSYYYFHVVCWLDRLLYAPSPIREGFVRELQEL